MMFENFQALVTGLDDLVSSSRKRHIVGGILLSASMLFAGLSLTVMTINKANREDDCNEC